MQLNKGLLAEFEHEMTGTRKTLERIPDNKFDWRPHEKSWTVGELGSHLANLPSWASLTINTESFDMAPPGEEPPQNPQAGSTAEILTTFDKNIGEAKNAIAGVGNEDFLKPWTLLSGGKTIFSLPKIAVVRSFVINHIIHHRAQLGVYLRLNDVAVPAIYGPTADEGM